MKVIHIINDLFAYGGTPKKLRYLVKYSNKEKYNHVFICINRAEILEQFDGLSVTVKNADGSILKALALIKAEIDQNDTVICVHFFKAFITGVIASIIYRVPLINNEHGSAYYRTGYKKYIMQLFKSVPLVTICNSKYVLGTIADQFKFQVDKLLVVYNPVEQRQIINVPKLDICNNRFVIGHVGGFIEQRNQLILIDALLRLREKGINAYLILIGDGPERKNLEDKSKELNIVEYVDFVGYVDDVGGWLEVFDVYINPTLDEGFGIAVVEAMLAGVPVVAAKAGAHKEIINDSETGLLYEAKNIDSLVSKIELLYEDVELKNALSLKATIIAQNRFSAKTYSTNYHDVLDNIYLEFYKNES